MLRKTVQSCVPGMGCAPASPLPICLVCSIIPIYSLLPHLQNKESKSLKGSLLVYGLVFCIQLTQLSERQIDSIRYSGYQKLLLKLFRYSKVIFRLENTSVCSNSMKKEQMI